MRTSTAPLRVKLIVLGLLAVSGITTMQRSRSADEVLARETPSGREVLVRGFGEVDSDCKPRPVQAIKVIEAPVHGRIEQRPGVVVIGDTGVAGAACTGTRLDGVQVFYIPDGHFVGSDRFAIDVEYPSRRTVHAKVDVAVAPMTLQSRS